MREIISSCIHCVVLQFQFKKNDKGLNFIKDAPALIKACQCFYSIQFFFFHKKMDVCWVQTLSSDLFLELTSLFLNGWLHPPQNSCLQVVHVKWRQPPRAISNLCWHCGHSATYHKYTVFSIDSIKQLKSI